MSKEMEQTKVLPNLDVFSASCKVIFVYAESVKNRHLSFMTLFKQLTDNAKQLIHTERKNSCQAEIQHLM